MNADHVKTPEHMVTTMNRVYEAGYVPEVTFRIDAGILREGMAELRRRRNAEAAHGRLFVLAVGSIIDTDELEQAVELGFDLLVGPGNMVTGGREPAETLKAIQEAGIAVAPAVFTPSELQYMLHNRHGFEPDVIKIFPARTLGSKGISDLLAPYAREKYHGKLVMPTGAVDEQTGPQFHAAICKRGFTPILGMSAPLALVSERKQPGNAEVIAESLEQFARQFRANMEAAS
jgi:2-keto-3-deoxy-6-phosphogluconate aldolase